MSFPLHTNWQNIMRWHLELSLEISILLFPPVEAIERAIVYQVIEDDKKGSACRVSYMLRGHGTDEWSSESIYVTSPHNSSWTGR